MRELSKKEGGRSALERGKEESARTLSRSERVPAGAKGSGHLDGRAVGSVRSLTKPMLHFAAH